MNIIKKLPVPISALMLGLASTGNLLMSYGYIYRNIFGIISSVIFLGLVLKVLTTSKTVCEDLKNPVIAGVSATFPMGMMVLSTYIKPYLPTLSFTIWILGLVIHCILIVYFTKMFILNFDIKKVFPSYFVVYVGIVIASMTASLYGLDSIGQGLFWFGFISYIVLLPIVAYRVIKVKNIPEPALPTIAIFAAPGSLCLAGYIDAFQDKNIGMIVFLTILSQVIFLAVLLYMPKLLKLKFYPSYGAFTFPIVISAISLKKVNAFLITSDNAIASLKYLVKFEEVVSVIIVIYVLARYAGFISSQEKAASTQR
ncbi:putative C4-dicarboxylate transporter/malic acid transport protein [Gottschalkia acidurici 9a]|uniref:C4-dicarboxylate transporter/malic acid transport protein n=1 Tax=Gottschalkia acidurici (strain ATCC 7906 / DSM 604 / BCRC 14475 / CIP 104303 / KCTC 5404 / NCIMB 10678 / 9a) TaxID=1128398 RepID=K0B0Y7_GOTA9|nr:TDT family transporter [Gottschalkia acidurici]AFS79683.1 putative C4-dicarboxylate transporter/malic acid transport protein [Gottschalkia acidurici 9a]